LNLRLGIGIPTFGDAAKQGIGVMAAEVERLGFDGVWLLDHVVLLDTIITPYPFSADGTFFVPSDTPWLEAVASLAYLAGVTQRVTLGIMALVAPLRDPRVLSQQLAAIDQLSGGRVCLGLGAGWLREEFDALEVPFAGRGARLESGVAVMRECWTGAPRPGEYGPFAIPPGVRSLPVPVRGDIPLMLAGDGPVGLERAARLGTGWMTACSYIGDVAPEAITARRHQLLDLGARPDLPIGLRARYSSRNEAAIAGLVAAYAESGLTDLVLDINWADLARAGDLLERLGATVGLPRPPRDAAASIDR
jgi:probable F420-dependent oxidoreductase